MADPTKHYTGKSLSFVDLEGVASISLCTEEGDYLVIQLPQRLVALLNEGSARYVGNIVRDASR